MKVLGKPGLAGHPRGKEAQDAKDNNPALRSLTDRRTVSPHCGHPCATLTILWTV